MYTKDIIVAKMVGKIIPDAFMEKVFTDNKISNLGFAVATEGVVKSISTMDKDFFNTKALAAVQENFKDDAVIFNFSIYGDGFQKDCMQPFTLITNSKEEPLLVGFLSGEYPGFHQEKSTLSPANWAVNKYLMPMIQKEYSDCGNDIKKLMDRVRTGTLQLSIAMAQQPGGFMSLLASTGEIMMFHDRRAATNFSFGWTTDTVGYSEDEVERKEPEVKKEKSLLSLAGASPTPAPEPVVEPTAVPDVKPQEAAPAEQQDDLTEFETVIVEVPKEVQGRANKQKGKDWFRNTFGFLPHNYQQLKEFAVRRNKTTGQIESDETSPVPITKGKILRSFAELGNSASALTPVQGTVADAPVKQEVAAAASASGAEQPTSTDIPKDLAAPRSTLDAADITAIKKDFIDAAPVKKSLDRHGQAIANPEAFKTSLSKVKSFADEMSIKMTDTYKWDQEALAILCKTRPEAAALLMMNYRSATPEFRAYVDTLSKPAPVQQKTEEQGTTKRERRNMAA
jgi:hypothetical protein